MRGAGPCCSEALDLLPGDLGTWGHRSCPSTLEFAEPEREQVAELPASPVPALGSFTRSEEDPARLGGPGPRRPSPAHKRPSLHGPLYISAATSASFPKFYRFSFVSLHY